MVVFVYELFVVAEVEVEVGGGCVGDFFGGVGVVVGVVLKVFGELVVGYYVLVLVYEGLYVYR